MLGPTLWSPSKPMLLAGFLAGSIVLFTVLMQAADGKEEARANQLQASSLSASPAAKTLASFPAAARSTRATMMYRRLWGVDDLRVKRTASGELLRFSWRVVDVTKAKALCDKKETPYLIESRTGAKLEVVHAEKVGQLRQVATPQNGREYWMAFFNLRRAVEPGGRVDVVIGKFRANGLPVE